MGAQLTGTRGLLEDIARWRHAVGTRAPSYHRLLEEFVALLDGDTAQGMNLKARLHETWVSRIFRIFYERPLLLLAALRMDALVEGTAHPLWPALVATEPDPTAATRGALLDAFARGSVWQSLRTQFIQTNETSRAVAWLWPAHIMGCDDGVRPLVLVEVGSAAGLNLTADRLPGRWTSLGGAPLPTARELHTLVRLGIDAHPLDALNDRDANWLRACVWAGERERILRLEAAIAAFRSSPAQLEQGDVSQAPGKLGAFSAQRPARAVVLAFQTIVRDYLDEETRAGYEQGMRRWLEAAPAASAAWIELEIDHGGPENPVPIVAHVREETGVVDIVLGTTGFHPATVTVDDASVARLASIFR